MSHNPTANSEEMSPEQRALLALLRSALWQTDLDDPAALPLSDSQWTTVYDLAKQQTVAALLWNAIKRLPDNLLPCDTLLMRWAAKVAQTERLNREMNAALDRLLRTMADSNIHPTVLKGQGVAALYDTPSLRECGDIDLFFASADDEARAADLMLSHGCLPQRQPDGSHSYQWMDIEVEHHMRLVDIYNPRMRDALTHREFTETTTNCSGLPVPQPVAMLLMLNAHLLKHLMGHGIGLRQFCDMAVAYRSLHRHYDAAHLESLCRQAGIVRWSRQLHAFLTLRLGLDPQVLPFGAETKVSGRMERIVWQGGNFGHHSGNRGDDHQPAWLRKVRTAVAFVRNSAFSLAYAPSEAFWTTVCLAKGNITKRK